MGFESNLKARFVFLGEADKMKRMTKILISLFILTSITISGSTYAADLYKLAIGSPSSKVAISKDMLSTSYGINIDVLGLTTSGSETLKSLSYLEFDIAVDKTAGKCAMYIDVDVNGRNLNALHFSNAGDYSTTGSDITCSVSDEVSTLTIQIFPQGELTAQVMIVDATYGPLFIKAQTFKINPKE